MSAATAMIRPVTAQRTKPYATLAKAVDAANDGATVYVMSDLTMTECARFYSKSLTITSLGDATYTITRGDNFAQQQDNAAVPTTPPWSRFRPPATWAPV